MNIAVISCTKLKQDYACQARELYMASTLFKKATNYISGQNYDAVYILSALHGLLGMEDVVAPYEKTLNGAGVSELREWSNKVSESIIRLAPKKVVFYAGRNYRKFLIPILEKEGIECGVPLQGMGIGEQLQFYSNELRKTAHV